MKVRHPSPSAPVAHRSTASSSKARPRSHGAKPADTTTTSSPSQAQTSSEPRGGEHGSAEHGRVLGGDAKKPRTIEHIEATSLLELQALAERDGVDQVFDKLAADFKVALTALKKQAPSIVFFGGARLKPGDPHYVMAEQFGARLAPRAIPPKTGAGPGAMHVIPHHYIEARELLAAKRAQTVIDGIGPFADLDDLRTLGFNIKLPKEQKVSPAIESSQEISLFAFRKFALYENVRGIVVFPGGFGTIDELMEVLVLAKERRHNDPIVLAGTKFWQPIVDAWRASAKAAGVDASSLDRLLITDDPDHAYDFIESRKGVRAFDDDPDVIKKRMTRELKLARYVATRQKPAVTFLGGSGLSKDHKSLAIAREIAQRLGDEDVRVGQTGALADAVLTTAKNVQAVLWKPKGPATAKATPSTDKLVAFEERIPHKETLLRNSRAYVALPCAERGKDEMTSVLCQIQTGKLPRRPIVLVDRAFWEPIVKAWGAQMIGSKHGYIERADLDLVVYADSVDDAMRALAARAD